MAFTVVMTRNTRFFMNNGNPPVPGLIERPEGKIDELGTDRRNRNINISVDFYVTDQLQMKYSAFVRYWREKREYNVTVKHKGEVVPVLI
jgi:hypothetical protein